MSDAKNTPSGGRRRPGKNTFTTKSGRTIKLNQSIGERLRARRDDKARKRAAYLSTLPKDRFKRILYRLHPKRVFHYWFSRQGAIMALKITGIGIVAGFILLVGLFAYFRKDLPKINDISGSANGGSTIYYDRTGQTVLYEDYDSFKRLPVPGDQIAEVMKQATIATEDKNFYKHGAFDITGIIRAGLHDIKGGSTQGGSTITQQLVKLNQNYTNDRTITRKIKELILAVEVEREYSKQDILTAYLNTAPYGNVQNGVEAATRDYFQKSAKDLTLPEAAMMAAIPKTPSYYSPYGAYYDSKLLLTRQKYIIDLMADQKMITKAQADEAKKVDILALVHPPAKSQFQGLKAPYFVLAARQELNRIYGEKTIKKGGWKIITTVDLNLQNIAEEQVKKGIVQIRKQGGDTAAFVAEDNKTGQIVALVGGADFNNPDHGELNFATRNISPGSTFKPYDAAAFIDNNTNVGAGSVLFDRDTKLPAKGYECTNTAITGGNCLRDYDNRQPGPITIRYAFGGSRNVPFVKAMLSAVPNDTSKDRINSINKTIATAQAMMKAPGGGGYRCYETGSDVSLARKEDETQCFASSALGDGAYINLDDHVNGLATLGRMGVAIPRTYILKITDANNKVLAQFQQPAGEQVIKPDTAYIVNDIAADYRASYLPGSCTEVTCTNSYKFHRYNGWKFAIKTGTTNYKFDGLMASWSSQYTVVAWAGYHDRNKPLRDNMETMTQPIVRGWMQAAHDALKTKPVNWAPPAGLKTLPAFVVSNTIGGAISPSPANDIFPSWYTQTKPGSSGNQVVDKISNKLATSCTPELAKNTLTNSNANNWSVDVFVNGGAASQAVTGDDDVHKCDDAKPSITLTAPDTCGSTATPCTFTVTVTQGTHPLSSASLASVVSLKVNGQDLPAQSASSSPSTLTFTYTPTAAGPGSVQATVVDSVLYSATQSANVTFVTADAAPQ